MDRLYSALITGGISVYWLLFLSPYSSHQSVTTLDPISIHLHSKSEDKGLLFPIANKSEEDIISHYGEPRGNGRRIHEGMDIPAKKGTPIFAVNNGEITKVTEKGNGGKQVWLKSEDHTFFYAHLDSWEVEEGQNVNRGDVIGTVGNTGNASKTLPHLHFGVYVDRRKTIDPEELDWDFK